VIQPVTLSSRITWRLTIALAVVLGAMGLGACSSDAAASTTSRPIAAAPSLPTPMATSIETGDGTWVTFPMGRLDEALNTFWQLFFEPTAGGTWSNRVEATATATNGGLVLAPTDVGGLVVGVRPSSYLTYTPLVSAVGPATSWSNGLIDAALAARPDALASGPGGDGLALIGHGSQSRVVASSGSLSIWRSLVDERALATTGPGRACGLAFITAVGYLGTRAMIGASCRHADTVGLYVQRGGEWQLANVRLPHALSHGRVEVLALQYEGSSATALLAVAQKTTTSLVAAWSVSTGHWTTSSALRVSAGASVASFGPVGGSGLFALVQSAGSRDTLAVTNHSDPTWRDLPSPPVGTATIAFASPSSAAAFVATTVVVTIWSLNPATNRWVAGHVVDVPIQFGSSSQ